MQHILSKNPRSPPKRDANPKGLKAAHLLPFAEVRGWERQRGRRERNKPKPARLAARCLDYGKDCRVTADGQTADPRGHENRAKTPKTEPPPREYARPSRLSPHNCRPRHLRRGCNRLWRRQTASPALVCGWMPPPKRIFREGLAPFGAGADSGNQGSFAGLVRTASRLGWFGWVSSPWPKAVRVCNEGWKPLARATAGMVVRWHGWPLCVPARGFFF